MFEYVNAKNTGYGNGKETIKGKRNFIGKEASSATERKQEPGKAEWWHIESSRHLGNTSESITLLYGPEFTEELRYQTMR